MKQLHGLLPAICAAVIATSAQAEAAWPDVAMPGGVSITSVARHTALNGMPMRIDMFSSRKTAAELLDFYRHEWGARHVENTIRGTTVIGRVQGEFYITVQIKPAARGAQGVIAVTRMNAPVQAQSSGFQFPPGSRILSDMESEDFGKTSRHLVFTNTYSLDVNRDRLVDLMKEKGLSLERIGKPREAGGDALFFKGKNKEAIAVVAQQSGQTSVVLNITSQLPEAR
jgi:hypothetical protein